MTKHLKLVAVLLALFVATSCGETAEDKTTEEAATNTTEQMKVVQPVVDSAYEAAAEGDSTLLE
ncbi:MAG TPA: hypothetical protein VIN07_01735, partial [Flavipsychrobacter sp.]